MNKISKIGESHKNRRRNKSTKPTNYKEEAPLLVRAPVYAASLGLFCVYAWGYLNAGLGGLAWGLVGVTAMSEMLKPQLGELAAHALDASDKTAQSIVAAAALVCVILGAAGGIVAMHVAEAPANRSDAAQRDLDTAITAVQQAQAKVDSVPTCTPEMPASRCEQMTAENAPVLMERRARLATAQANERGARATLARTPIAGPGLPHVELWQKALFVGGAEFLMFGVPFAALRLRRRDATPVQQRQEPVEPIKSEPKASEERANVKINDGGWASRRAKYGPTGRKFGAGGVRLQLVQG
ncbi:MAG: hypothetical protein WAU68_15615 [Vitreimonas sp.]